MSVPALCKKWKKVCNARRESIEDFQLLNESASPDQISKWTQQAEDAADLRKMRFKDLNAKNIQAMDIYDVQLAGSKIVPKLFRMVATLTHFTQLYPENKYSWS